MTSFSPIFFLTVATVAFAKNDAIHDNPGDADIGLTTHGSDWLWAVFATILLSDLIFVAWSFKVPRGERVFHQIPVIVLTASTIAYFSLASNLGSTPVRTEFRSGGATRAIWFVRYIDWVITAPLILLELFLSTGLNLSEIVTALFFSIVLTVLGLVGALVPSTYKWGYYTMAVFSLFYIIYILLGPARVSAGLLGADVKKAYSRSAIWIAIVWSIYPIAWALAEGSNTITITGEMVFYGVLDLFAKPFFLLQHVAALRNIPYSTYALTSGKFSETATGPTRIHSNDVEKSPAPATQ